MAKVPKLFHNCALFVSCLPGGWWLVSLVWQAVSVTLSWQRHQLWHQLSSDTRAEETWPARLRDGSVERRNCIIEPEINENSNKQEIWSTLDEIILSDSYQVTSEDGCDPPRDIVDSVSVQRDLWWLWWWHELWWPGEHNTSTSEDHTRWRWFIKTHSLFLNRTINK